MLMDSRGTLDYVSPSLESVAGYGPDSVVGLNVFDFVHPDDLSNLQELVADVISGAEAPATLEWRMKNASGEWRWVEGSARNLLHDPDVESVVINWLRELVRLGCEFGQGYYFSRPLPADAMENMLSSGYSSVVNDGKEGTRATSARAHARSTT